jgi:4-carboxymuconolactone decarboxylase
MSRTPGADARAEHDVLFRGRTSDLARTDPEFVAFFDDFAFDETLRAVTGDLPRPERLMYQLGAVIAVGAVTEYRVMLGAALDNGVTPIQVKEIVYQATAYVGIARVIDFLHTTNELLTERGVALPLEGQSSTTPETRNTDGLARQKEIVGDDAVDGMYANAPADARRFQEFLSGNCFGDYYTRGGLDVRQRELLTFSVLVALGGADGQVKGHVKANVNVGNTRAQLLDVLTVLLPFVGYPRTLNGLAAVNEVAPAG